MNKIAVSYVIYCLCRMVFKYLIQMNSVRDKTLFFDWHIRSGYALILIVSIVQYSSTLSGHLSKPMNTVSVVGNRAKLECSRNPSMFPINWEFASTGSSNFSFIYISQRIPKNHSSRYKIDTDNNTRYDIVIDYVDLFHAGTYKCTPITEEVINASSDSAELIVLASDPVCNTNASTLSHSIVEGDYIRMCCSVNYSGNWIPVMEWTTSNGRTVDADILYVTTSTTVTSSLIIQLDSTDNGVTFTCKTSFNLTNTFSRTLKTGEVVATTVPTYQHLWNFTANVFYKPRNLTITGAPMKSAYEVGDRLTCWANGNPTPDYQWMDIETNRTIPGSVLTIVDDMSSDQNHNFKCTAYNTVAGLRNHIDKTVTFTVTGGSTHATEQNIIIAVITIGAVCSLLLALYLCNSRFHCMKGTGRAEPDILQIGQGYAYDYNLQQRRRSPVYSEVRREVNRPIPDGPHRLLFQPVNPDYSVVKRETSGKELCIANECAIGRLPKQQGIPVYTEVVKNGNGSKNSEVSRQTVEAAATEYHLPEKTLTGADGTQYLDVTSIRDPSSGAPFRHPPMFSVVETYASIDHTLDDPPPILPKRR